MVSHGRYRCAFVGKFLRKYCLYPDHDMHLLDSYKHDLRKYQKYYPTTIFSSYPNTKAVFDLKIIVL